MINPELNAISEPQFYLLQSINKEYEAGMKALNSMGTHTVTFYGGSRVEENSVTYKHISKLATEFAKQGWGVVTGGGPGVMSAALEGAKIGEGKAIGFMISIPGEPPFAKSDIAVMFDHFSPRKYCLRQSDVFVYAPGGIGTLDELMENLTLIATGKNPEKPIFLFDSKFWKPYLDWFEQLVYKEKLASESFLKLFHVVDSYEEITKVLFPIEK